MKKSLAAIASAFLVTCAPAFAQTAAAPDPATAAAVKQLLVAMHARETMAAVLHQVEERMPVQMRQSATAAIESNPKLDGVQKAEALAKVDEALRQSHARMHTVLEDPSLIDEMLAAIVPLYADTYTLDEIRQLTAFYNSPLGQKTVAKTPELMGRSMQAANQVMMPRIQQVMAQYGQAAAGNSAGK